MRVWMMCVVGCLLVLVLVPVLVFAFVLQRQQLDNDDNKQFDS